MSSLKDPFDLLKTGQEMDNVVPFLSPTKVNLMIDKALAQSQVAAQKPEPLGLWKYGGMAIAACLALFMVFMTPTTPISVLEGEAAVSVAHASSEDVSEFGELVMLETWERY